MAYSVAIAEGSAVPPRGVWHFTTMGRIVLIVVLTLSGILKAVDPRASILFLDAMLARAAIAPTNGRVLTMLLVVIELALAAGLLVFFTRRWILICTLLFFVGAASAMAWSAWQGIGLGCGCFGGVLSLTPRAASVRAGGFALGCLALLCVQHAFVSGVSQKEVRSR